MTRAQLGPIDRHFWLNRSVARSMGINFTEAIADGRLDAEGYAELLTRCRAGGCDRQCEHWLGCLHGQVDDAPEHCANRDRLNALKAPDR
ncbi:MAG: hypothetical protein GJ676_13025 [Rhodobacteraceae bacterium]|nr:hypothetical protein [Paracoccaceae bacterium]